MHLLLQQAMVQQAGVQQAGVLLPLQLDALHHDLVLVVLTHLLLAWLIFRWQTPDPPFQPFNFDAASINIIVETPTMSTTGRRTAIGTFLIPNTQETDVIVQVSADGCYAELSYRVPPMFLYLVDRFAQEVGANHPDAPVIMAALRDVENLMLHEHPDRNNIYTNVQRRRLPFLCIQNPVIDFLYLDEGLQSGMTTVLTVTFESQERVRTAINYGSHRVIVRNPPRGLGGVPGWWWWSEVKVEEVYQWLVVMEVKVEAHQPMVVLEV